MEIGNAIMFKPSGGGIPTTNLLCYYDFSNTTCYNGSGTSYNDLSPNGYNGTFNSAPTFQNNFGGEVYLNGSVYGLSNPIFDATNWTIHIWAKLTTAHTINYCLGTARVVGTGGWTGIQIGAAQLGSPYDKTTFYSDYLGTIHGLSLYTISTWRMITIKKTNVGVYQYINGVFDASNGVSSNTTVLDKLLIGVRGDLDWKFNGAIGAVVAYNESNSDELITSIYNILNRYGI